MNTTYVMVNGKLVEKSPTDGGRRATYVMPDLVERISPVDGTVISSRGQLADHNRRNNVVDVGNDPAFAPGAERKQVEMPPVGPDVKQAIDMLQSGYRGAPVETMNLDSTRLYGSGD